MRLHRFFTRAPLDAVTIEGALILSEAELVHQLRLVLRAKHGDTITLFDGSGREATVQIKALNKDTIETTITSIAEKNAASMRNITLYTSMPKRENFELIAQKVTEIGMTGIVPIISKRTVKTGLNRERVEKIIIEAAEQSGRTTIPMLGDMIPFSTAIAEAQGVKIFFDGSAKPLANGDFENDNISIFIGPEGGWSEDEIALAKTNGAEIRSLGSTTLRAETAAIVASYLAVSGN